MGWLIVTALVLASFLDIEHNIGRLPARIPTHFDFSGLADRWGPRNSLWVTLAVQVLTCALILLIPLLARWRPNLAHFGSHRLSDFSPEQQQRVLPMFKQMTAYLSILIAFGFHLLIHERMHAAAEPQHRLPVGWLLTILLVAPLALVVYYLPRVNRIAKGD